MQYHVPVTLSK